MSGFEGVIVSDPRLQSQFTQVELRSLKAKFSALKLQSGHVTVSDLPPVFTKLKGINAMYTENEVRAALEDSYPDVTHEIDFESFLREYLGFQGRASGKGTGYKRATSILRQSTTTHFHVISESEKESYVTHINNHLAEDPFLKKFLPLDPKTNQLFELAKDGVLLCKLINLAVPGTIDERAINTKKTQNPWERNENHTLCLNSAKAIGCTVVNIGTQDLVEGRRHLVMGLISQIIKIQLLADLNLKKTPQLVELVEDNQDVEELMNLPPDKVLLKWMNFQLKKSGYKKEVTNFSTDLKDGEAYAHLLNVLAPEHKTNSTLETKDPTQRAKLIVEQAGKLDCNRYISPKDIVEGSTNLNLTFVAQIFQHRNGLTAEVDTEKISLTNVLDDDLETSREERCFRLWINSLGVSSYVNNLFEDVRQGWVLLEVLDKVFPGSVNWRHANKPPIKMPFKKVENCNQVVDIGKRLNFSLVNVAGNDIVQGNKKLIIAFLWQLMRFTMLRLLKNLRSFSQGREITDAHILEWANKKVKSSGKSSQIDSFKDKSLSSGIFFLELLSAVEPRVVDWTVVTKGEEDEDKKLNASYIISVARKLGCSIFLLPEDIVEVNQKMILTLTASIMYWSLQKKPGQLDVLEETEDASPTADEDSVDPEDASPTAVEDLTDPAEASPSAIENLTDPAEASPSAIENLTDPTEASPFAVEDSTTPDKASPFAVEGSADLAEPSSPAVEGSTDSAKASQSLLDQPKEK